ncbi:tRNA lysidine(34) synthetase TilS [Acinetobacter sp. ANC 5579]|uniref:tRNA lysidine(34) synthetase TilS n=1 Tax=Acinetobacter amyesii TaxID=2942470 RepID=UPI0020BF6EB4|nr:tRNA lysidine(34) synthetase TilS [Acinetobacter amyesii]MCL6235459.1 tRNA lysidine(34) synthetase TilS [Acinetobacter amyesii]
MRSALSAFNEVWQRQFRADCLSQIQALPEQSRFLIGCSGGMDSMLLLHLMSFLCPEKMRVIYIDHQLQDCSHAWGEFVRAQCKALNLPFIIQKVQVAQGNLENQARSARYQAFRQHLQADEILVLAHHQQDQAETLMLRLLSGAGVHGLAAMKKFDAREDFTLWRPLLDLSREQICQWAAQLHVQNIQDLTNFDTDYDRAWSREILWPLLSDRFPKMQQALSRTSYLMQDADEILNEVLQQDLAVCGSSQALSLVALQQLSLARQRQLLSHWMKGEGQYRPSFEMVQRLFSEVIGSREDSQAALHWNGFYYLRFQQQLHRIAKAEYLPTEPIQEVEVVTCVAGQCLKLPAGHFVIQPSEVGLSPELLGQQLQIRPRLGGEKIHLYGRVGSWPLKKAIQQAQIFPWQRHTIQILSRDNVMLGVFTPQGFWLAQSEFCTQAGWQPTLSLNAKSAISDLQS